MYYSLLYYKIYKRKEKQKKEEKRTKLHKWEKTYPKNSSPLCSEKSGVFIG